MSGESAGNKAVSGKKEVAVMKLSFVVTAVFALIGVAVAIVCDSMTLLLDGLYGLAEVAVSLIAIFVLRKLHSPPDEKYHFGYAKYEPLMTAVQGMLIATICSATIITSVQDLFNPDPMGYIHLAIAFAVFDFAISFSFFLFIRKEGEKHSSRILMADSTVWLIESLILFAVSVTFIFAAIISKTRWAFIASYIDPALCIIISLAILYKPVSILGESLRDLVDASPGKEVVKRIRGLVDEWKRKHGLIAVKWLKVRRAGRCIFVNVCYETDKESGDLSAIREQIRDEAHTVAPELDLCVVFIYYHH